MHPTLTAALTRAASHLRQADICKDKGYHSLLPSCYYLARSNLLHALKIAKVLGLGQVVARCLLALREVGKAKRALVA